ncbi:MAG: hypothetical protein FWD06_01075 [Oscillospiraceae bacterium]|nr:hypothetical protein [Oscillospiraceae bacterium]
MDITKIGRSRKHARHMQHLNLTEAELRRIEKGFSAKTTVEFHDRPGLRLVALSEKLGIRRTVLNKSWFYRQRLGSAVLLPLHELEQVQFTRMSHRGLYEPVGEGYAFHYVFRFRNGVKYHVNSFGNAIHQALIKMLAQHCPQINVTLRLKR